MASEKRRTLSRWRAAEPDHQLPPARESREGRREEGPRERAEPSIGDLLRSLAEDMRTLVRQEIELAKVELTRTAKGLAVDGAWIGAGIAVAAVGGLVLVVALALLLGALLGSYWLGTLIVGVVLVLAGAAAVWRGARGVQSRELMPHTTAETLREDADWARTEANEFKNRVS